MPGHRLRLERVRGGGGNDFKREGGDMVSAGGGLLLDEKQIIGLARARAR